MTSDLRYLVWTVLLALMQMLIAVIGAIAVVGLPRLAANRENLPPIEGWAGRARRAHQNLMETLPLFAALVLVAAVTSRANAMTALGAAIYFWARVVYAGVYIAGVPWLRTAVWGAGLAGLALILFQLF